MRVRPSAAFAASLLLAATLSCGGDDDQRTVAIDALFTKVRASILSGGQTIDAALYETPPSSPDENGNPAAYPSDSTKTLTLSGKANDGSAGLEVTVTNKFTANVDGGGEARTTVSEKVTGFKFLDYTVAVRKPDVTWRVPRNGLSSLKADGTGQAFVILSLKTTGQISRTLANTNSGTGKSLFTFPSAAPAPANGTATSAGSGTTEMLLEVKLSKASGKLQALLGKQAADYSARLSLVRADGPTFTDASLTFTKAKVGSADAAANDFIVAIGKDAAPAGGQAANATVDLAFTAAGGGSGAGVSTFAGLMGPFSPPRAQLTLPAATFQGALTGLDKLDDGTIQIDRGIGIQVMSGENVPRVDHSISDEDTLVFDVGSAAYLGSMGGVIRSIVLMR